MTCCEKIFDWAEAACGCVCGYAVCLALILVVFILILKALTVKCGRNNGAS